MSFIVKKKINGSEYYYLRESVREKRKVYNCLDSDIISSFRTVSMIPCDRKVAGCFDVFSFFRGIS